MPDALGVTTNADKKDKPVFGQYACAAPNGAILRVGDVVQVTEQENST